jgi:hypothetical protein
MTKISGDSFGADFSQLKDALNFPAGAKEAAPAASGTPPGPAANSPDEIFTPVGAAAQRLILGPDSAPAPGGGTGGPAARPAVAPEFQRQLTGGLLRASRPHPSRKRAPVPGGSVSIRSRCRPRSHSGCSPPVRRRGLSQSPAATPAGGRPGVRPPARGQGRTESAAAPPPAGHPGDRPQAGGRGRAESATASSPPGHPGDRPAPGRGRGAQSATAAPARSRGSAALMNFRLTAE